MTEKLLPVFKIERFSTVDGDGIRTVVFLKGCPLNCIWCHNPESKKIRDEILFDKNKCVYCGSCVSACRKGAQKTENGERVFLRDLCESCFDCIKACPSHALENCIRYMTVDEILKVAEKDKSFYGEKGGLTLSGGEPTVHGDLTVELLNSAKKHGLNTAIETCGYFDENLCEKLACFVDTFLWDYKITEGKAHKLYTGVDNEKILDNLHRIDSLGAKTVLRCILLKGINDEQSHYDGIFKVYSSLKNCTKVELFSYHPYGGTKNTLLGGEDNGKKERILSNGEINTAKKYLKRLGVKIG